MSFDVDIQVRAGGFTLDTCFATGPGITALFGPSGAGKTTVLNCVAGLARTDAGRITVAGRVLFDAAASVDVPPEARRAGYVFQDGRLFPHLRVRENLRYGWREGTADFDATIHRLGIGHLLHRWPRHLSGGETQRVAIGRALLSNPAFLLLDEPLAHLDRARRGEVLELIGGLRELGLPILYVTHDAEEIAALGAARVEM